MTTNASMSSVPKGERDEEITLNFKIIGDHSILGILQYRGLLIPNKIIGKHVIINAKECWNTVIMAEFNQLLALKPASIKINIDKLI